MQEDIHYTTNNNQNLIKGLRDNWVLIAFAAGIIATWTNFSSHMRALEEDVSQLKSSNEKQSEQINKINTDFGGAIIEIKANYLFIKEKLEKLDKNG